MTWERKTVPALLVGGALVLGGCAATEGFMNGLTGGGDTGSASVGEADDKQNVKTATEDADAQYDLPEYNGVKQAIGVIDSTNRSGWNGSYNLGSNLTIMLESALFDTNRFVLVEREQLSDLIREQDLQTSGRMAQANKVAQTGKLRPAQYLATVEITSVEDNSSGGGGGVRVRGIRVGSSGGKARITCIAKLIDSTSGEIVAKKSITGEAGRSKLTVGVYRRGIGADFNQFQKTPIGEAAQDVINQAAFYIAKQMEDKDITGAVVTTAAGRVIINRGSRHNYQDGMRLEMIEEGEELIDPNTGQLLGTAEGKKLGELRITRVDEKIAYCDVLTGTKSPPPGTLVKLLE
jgi:curli biogenesis system outer membrane secretion channel CsgG